MKPLKPDFERIYQGHYQRVIRMCKGYVNGDETAAKDLAQEVFIKVWDNLGSFRNESSIATWIYRITVNTCLLELRGKKFTEGPERLQNMRDSEDEIHPSKEMQLRQMYHCINKLPKESKAIILLELEGLECLI